MPQRSGRVSSFYGKPFCPFFCILLRTAAYMVDIAQLVRVSGCGPEGRRFEPGYPPHIFRSVPRPFTCRAADIAEGRRIFYVPAFAFTLPFCLLRVFAFFSFYRLFLFLYAQLSGFFSVFALYCIPSVLPALSGRSLPSLSGLRFLTAALSLFALLFVPFVCRPSCAHFSIAHFLFLSLGYLLRFPGAACAPFCGFSAVGTDDAESILSSGCGSVGRAGGLGPSGRRFESCHSDQAEPGADTRSGLFLFGLRHPRL